MSVKLLTTGQAARLCSVTADTVLKWIKGGRLAAVRTAGGHYRIRRDDLAAFGPGAPQHAAPQSQPRPFQYCWEYNATEGELAQACLECVVYRTRAYRCYEMLAAAPEAGHAKHYCKKTCAECDYYAKVHQQEANVLVVSDNQLLIQALKRDAAYAPFNLEITACEYTCSQLVDSFRPDFAVVDCSLGKERSREFAQHLLEDPRVPLMRVILAADKGEFAVSCDREIFARIQTPFSVADIADCIDGVRFATGVRPDQRPTAGTRRTGVKERQHR